MRAGIAGDTLRGAGKQGQIVRLARMGNTVRLREQHSASRQGVDVRIAVPHIHDLRVTAIFLDYHDYMIRARQLPRMGAGHENKRK